MRVKGKNTPHAGVHPARQRAIATVNAPRALPSRRGRLSATGANSVAAVVAGILGAAGLAVTGTAHAQAAGPTLAPPPTSAQTSQNLQEVVVTATATAVKKLDASYNIVSVDRDLIKQSNPISSADILKVAPGIWPESSGGQTGANIEVAGFPSGGDAPFFTNMIEGMPLYGMPNLSFMDSSSFFRLDDTVDRVEIVQLGTAALFGPGQMGATANYLLRTGDTSPGGSVGVTYGTDHKWRVDVFNGFKVADGWYGAFGGFYRTENGVRDPQFPENNGGQFTATLKHDLNGGNVMFWARVVDDKNQFIVPVPLIESGNGDFSSIPGFNALTGTYGSYAIQNATVPNPMGGFQQANLANGRGTQFYYFGSNYDQTFGKLALHNGFIADGGGLDTNALFSGANPRPLSMYLYGCNVPEPAGWCNGATPIDTNNLGDFTVNGTTYSASGTKGSTPTSTLPINAVYAGSGQPVPLSQSVIQQGWWFIQKSLQNFADEFRATMEIFPHDNLTGGVYLSVYSDNDKWSLGNQMLMTNTNNATAIALNYAAGGTIYNLSSPQGFVNDNGNFNIVEHGVGRNVAGYLSDAWHYGPWLIDAGARLENLDAHQRTCNSSKTALGTAADLWDNAVPICNGTWDYEHYERTRPTFTGGINYEIASNMSVYVRINNGVHFDDFDNGIRQANCTTACGRKTASGFSPLNTVQNQEFGFKWQTSLAYIDLDFYHRTFSGLTAGETTALGAPTGVNVVYGSKAIGLNFDGYITPFKGFVIRAVGDYMDGSYENAATCYAFTNLLGQQQCVSYNGSPLQRQPKFQIRVTPSYTMPMPWGDATAEVQFEHVGQRYEDQTGLQPLGAYNEVDADLIADIGDHWQAWITGTNLTNTIALTEGNARKPGQEVGVGNVILARPLEGREVDFTVYYKW